FSACACHVVRSFVTGQPDGGDAACRERRGFAPCVRYGMTRVGSVCTTTLDVTLIRLDVASASVGVSVSVTEPLAPAAMLKLRRTSWTLPVAVEPDVLPTATLDCAPAVP